MFSNRLWPYWLASWGSLCILIGIAGCRGMPPAAYTSAISAPPAPHPASNEETSATPTVTPTTSPQPTSPTKPIEDMTATAIAATAVTATPTPVPTPPYIRISERASTSARDSRAEYPKVAYNPQANEYLVVWEAEDTPDGSRQIFGQRLTADGQEIGTDDFPISAMAPENILASSDPAVSYNPTANQYLVVWRGRADADGVAEIHGQRLTADGQEIGADDFRISTMGPDDGPSYNTRHPDVVYNPSVNEYLVVWYGGNTESEYEIHGQRLTADGQEIGTDDFPISTMGPDGESVYLAHDPAVGYNPAADEYLVVWKKLVWQSGNDQTQSGIYGQRLTADGQEIGADDFRISIDSGSDPAVSYNSATDEYLVVWEGSHPTKDGRQVYGQRVTTDGQTLGDIVLYSNGHSAKLPAVTYNRTTDTYFIIWEGRNSSIATMDIYGQLVDGQTGRELGVNDRRLSDMQSYNPRRGEAFQPDVSYNPTTDEYLVMWKGETSSNGSSEHEIFGHLLNHSDIIRSYATYLPIVE